MLHKMRVPWGDDHAKVHGLMVDLIEFIPSLEGITLKHVTIAASTLNLWDPVTFEYNDAPHGRNEFGDPL